MSEDVTTNDLSEEERRALDRLYELAEYGSFYELLGVDRDADAATVQKAYYGISREWHPDRFFRRELGEYADRLETVFVTVTHAYKALSDPSKRRNYDRKFKEDERKRAEAQRKAAEADRVNQERAERLGRLREREVRRRDPGDAPGMPHRRPQREAPRSWRPAPGINRRRGESEAIKQIRAQVEQQVARAQQYYEDGWRDFEEGRVLKAASALRLAVRFNPRNEEYQEKLAEVEHAARQAQAAAAAAAAQQAETYHQVKEAIANYRRAVEEFESEDPKVLLRLGQLLRRYEEDDRAALALLRRAVRLAPDSPTYHLALAELYADIGLKLNATREYQAVLKIDPRNAEAKAGLKKL